MLHKCCYKLTRHFSPPHSHIFSNCCKINVCVIWLSVLIYHQICSKTSHDHTLVSWAQLQQQHNAPGYRDGAVHDLQKQRLVTADVIWFWCQLCHKHHTAGIKRLLGQSNWDSTQYCTHFILKSKYIFVQHFIKIPSRCIVFTRMGQTLQLTKAFHTRLFPARTTKGVPTEPWHWLNLSGFNPNKNGTRKKKQQSWNTCLPS